MEFASPYPKSSVYFANNSSNIKPKLHPCNTCNMNTTVTTPKSPIQILSPLQRPHHKEPQIQSIKPPITTTTTAAAVTKTTTTTTSDVLRLMDALGLSIPIDIYLSLIKECTKTRDAEKAIELHAHIARSGIRPRLPLLNRILLMYVFCRCIDKARQMFDKMPNKDSNSWAAMIAGYAYNNDYEEVIDLFVEMQHRHHDKNNILKFPGSWIIVCILKACVHTMNFELGSQIHGRLLKAGCSENLFLSSSLINFYGKMGFLDDAEFVFDQISRRSTVVWTNRIVNNCREERFDEAISVFKEMGREGVKKNSFTFSSVLKACVGTSDDGHCGRQVHGNAIKLGLVSKSYVQCALVDMYGKFGLVGDARRVFEMNGERRNNACWSAMLNGYIRHGFCVEAIKILYEMKGSGLQPQESLLNEVRCVCGGEILGEHD